MYPDESSRLLRLEQKVDFLFRHLGIDPDQYSLDDGFASSFGGAASFGGVASFGGASGPAGRPDLPSSFYDALSRGKKIQAIKIYREATGAGLKEAKDAVDRMA